MTGSSAFIPVSATPGSDSVQVTREGFERLQADLSTLREVERPGLMSRTQRAKLFMDPTVGESVAAVAEGDLAVLDRRIAELEALLAKAQIIGEDPDSSTVQVGSRVTVRYEDGTEETLRLVGPLEADLAGGYVSSESPAGKALVGKAPGGKVTVGSGANAMTLTIVSIEKREKQAGAATLR